MNRSPYLVLLGGAALVVVVVAPASSLPIGGDLNVTGANTFWLTVQSNGLLEREYGASVYVDGELVGVVYDGAGVKVELGGGPHTVEVDNLIVGGYYVYQFDHWSGGATDPVVEVVLDDNMSLTAYYLHTPYNSFDLFVEIEDYTLPGVVGNLTVSSRASFGMDVALSWQLIELERGELVDSGGWTLFISPGENKSFLIYPEVERVGRYNLTATLLYNGAVMASAWEVFAAQAGSGGGGSPSTPEARVTPTPTEIVIVAAGGGGGDLLWWIMILAAVTIVILLSKLRIEKEEVEAG